MVIQVQVKYTQQIAEIAVENTWKNEKDYAHTKKKKVPGARAGVEN